MYGTSVPKNFTVMGIMSLYFVTVPQARAMDSRPTRGKEDNKMYLKGANISNGRNLSDR